MQLNLWASDETVPASFKNDLKIALNIIAEKKSMLLEEIVEIKSLKDRAEKTTIIAKKLEIEPKDMDNILSIVNFICAVVYSKEVTLDEVKSDFLSLKFNKEKVEHFIELLKKIPKNSVETFGTMYAMSLIRDNIDEIKDIDFHFGIEAPTHYAKIIGYLPTITLDIETEEKVLRLCLTPYFAKRFFESIERILIAYKEYLNQVNEKLDNSVLREVFR